MNLHISVRSTLATFIMALGLATATSQAQNYQIDWFTIDGGGGTSSGGPYTLSGTIGQPDAGRLAGGNFVIEGGFWGGAIAVQQVGAPTLFIQTAGPGAVTLSWDPPTPGFVLQVTGDLNGSPIGWADAPSGGMNPVTVPITTDTRFYRLHRP